MSDKYVCRSIRLMPSRRLAGTDAKLAWLDLGRDSGPVGMSQASPSASIAGPLQQAMESTGVNNQVALDGGLMNQSVVLLGRLLRSNSGSDCLEPALVFGEIPQARHNTVFSSHRVHLSASSAASRSSSCVREHLPFCRISTPNIIRTASSRSNSVSLACLMIPAHLNQVSRTSSRNRTKRVPPNSDFRS